MQTIRPAFGIDLHRMRDSCEFLALGCGQTHPIAAPTYGGSTCRRAASAGGVEEHPGHGGSKNNVISRSWGSGQSWGRQESRRRRARKEVEFDLSSSRSALAIGERFDGALRHDSRGQREPTRTTLSDHTERTLRNKGDSPCSPLCRCETMTALDRCSKPTCCKQLSDVRIVRSTERVAAILSVGWCKGGLMQGLMQGPWWPLFRLSQGG